jgi:oxepin-CoA hydrolase/3-oxo-5,6-dehydrosuberyl-CoA semialdehyde dehydrogenase
MRVLESYLIGRWQAPSEGLLVADATTGEPVAQVSADGLDVAAALEHARTVGGTALRKLTFHQRAAILKALGKALAEHKEDLYALSARSGATRSDAWMDIDGGIGVLMVYGSKGAKELPDARFLLDGDSEVLAKDGSFAAQHILVPREGAAVCVNAFNFPAWGMLEKLAPAILSGVPVLAKPATPTAYVAEAVARCIVDAGVLPDGAFQFLCGGTGDLFDHLTGQDMVGFTGSSATAARLRSHPTITVNSVRFNAEADSLNASILGRGARPGTPEFDLYVGEVAREMTTKTGQRCTAIRRALVPAVLVDAVTDALAIRLAGVVVGDPRRDDVTMGPLVGTEQRQHVADAVRALSEGAEPVTTDKVDPVGADAERGAFFPPTVLVARDPRHPALHDVEAFGPVATVIPYDGIDDAVDLARLGAGSLVASVFTAEREEARDLTLGLAAHHGRVLLVNEACGTTQTGHGTAMPHTVHGGPGRAGGGEELGGLRALHHYLQRTAVQGPPDVLTAVSAASASTTDG